MFPLGILCQQPAAAVLATVVDYQFKDVDNSTEL